MGDESTMMRVKSGKGSPDTWANLAEVPHGESVVLALPRADKQLCRRLAQLGLRPGMTVSIAQSTTGGGRVIRSGTTRYAIDAATLRQMEVQR